MENPFWSRTNFRATRARINGTFDTFTKTSQTNLCGWFWSYSDSALSGIMMMHQRPRVWWLSRGRWWCASPGASGAAPGRLASAVPSSTFSREIEAWTVHDRELAGMQASDSESGCVLQTIKQFSIWLSDLHFATDFNRRKYLRYWQRKKRSEISRFEVSLDVNLWSSKELFQSLMMQWRWWWLGWTRWRCTICSLSWISQIMIHNLHSGLHNCAHCVHFALNSVLEMSWASLNAESFPVSDAVTRKCFPPSVRMCNKLKSSCWNLVRCWWCLVCGASECGIRQHSWQIIHWWIIPTAKHYSEAFISSSFRLICNHAACFQLDISSLPTVFMHCTAFEFFLVRL